MRRSSLRGLCGRHRALAMELAQPWDRSMRARLLASSFGTRMCPPRACEQRRLWAHPDAYGCGRRRAHNEFAALQHEQRVPSGSGNPSQALLWKHPPDTGTSPGRRGVFAWVGRSDYALLAKGHAMEPTPHSAHVCLVHLRIRNHRRSHTAAANDCWHSTPSGVVGWPGSCEDLRAKNGDEY